jgi:hypothetical protein
MIVEMAANPTLATPGALIQFQENRSRLLPVYFDILAGVYLQNSVPQDY